MSIRNHATMLLATLAVIACASSPPQEASVQQEESSKPRNIIFMVGDGMGFAQVKAYRYYANDPATPIIDPLPYDRYLTGAVATEAITTHCDKPSDQTEGQAVNCVVDPYGITDSASSASAYATGEDTEVGWMGVSVEGERQTNISERAVAEGIAVGLVSTSQVTHATPAAFYAHVKDRDEKASIADQLFDNQFDGMPLPQVILGGGTQLLQREDRDITAEFVAAGYKLATNRDELAQLESGRVLGLFAPIGMPRAWDRPATTPDLAEMTSAAIKLLDPNPEGFFLMVEGSQIDWAAHSNDIVGVISEMEDFSQAIAVALEYAEQKGDTLVVITADHETGGLSMGRDDLYHWNPRPLRGMKITPAGITAEFLAGDEPLSVVAQRHLSFELTAEEIAALDEAKVETPPYAEYGMDGTQAYTLLSLLFDKRTQSGWTGMGHTGVDVPLYAAGPGSEHFRGVIQNEELGQLLHKLLLSD
jgi:alkaline phosphatase